MPYAFCEGEQMPWHEYAENAETGPTARILSAVRLKIEKGRNVF